MSCVVNFMVLNACKTNFATDTLTTNFVLGFDSLTLTVPDLFKNVLRSIHLLFVTYVICPSGYILYLSDGIPSIQSIYLYLSICFPHPFNKIQVRFPGPV